MMMMMMMAMTKTMGITKITMKKKIKKLNFNYPSARLMYLYLSNNSQDSSSNVFCKVFVSSVREGGAGSTDL